MNPDETDTDFACRPLPRSCPHRVRREDTTGRAEPVSAAAESSQPAPEAEEPAESELSDRIPMVMVNGALYYDTGEESTLDGRCGTYDGEITTAVEGNEIPSEDGQSNLRSARLSLPVHRRRADRPPDRRQMDDF